MELLKKFAAGVLRRLYRVRIVGLEHYQRAGSRVMIVANHTSYLDAVLITVFLPDRLTFAINTHVASAWWVRPFLRFVEFFPLDPANPHSIRSLIRHLQADRRTVIFPEGRITVTGSLMKIYQGPGLVADRSHATLLPLRIEGAQYTPFSRLRGRVRLRWFPQVTLHFLPPRPLDLPPTLQGRVRRNRAGQQLTDIMTELMFATSDFHRTLPQALVDAGRIHGARRVVAEDVARQPCRYRDLLLRINVLGPWLSARSQAGDYVGVLLPNTVAAVTTFFALQLYGRIPAMLNFTAGPRGVEAALTAARISTIITSRRFVAGARLEELITVVAKRASVVYLEDLLGDVSWRAKLTAWLRARAMTWIVARYAARVSPADPAVVLFTSGSEGLPKGVVLSHENLLANGAQVAARLDFNSQDVVLNALPLFHSFGLTVGTLLPLLAGMKVFLYPSPLHYRIIPEVAYDLNATLLFGTNTFLAGYARFAHPYDFYSVRHVFAGAEKLHEETRRIWADKFGVRILEGYGTTETSPVLAANTAMESRVGTVGRLLPGVEYRLKAVTGVAEGGRLCVRGPNVMLGYLRANNPGVLEPPATEDGEGWYDTGDVVSVDDDGFVAVLGRLKRFAKIGGEMVSLMVGEELAAQLWPGHRHAVVSVRDTHKGEQLVLVTEYTQAARQPLLQLARQQGLVELCVPRRIVFVKDLPLLGSGKVDYPQLQAQVDNDLRGVADAAEEESLGHDVVP
jgi:acyl-[acyl-carrier-protein]-phospholipid O-acyltransferase/long-chain-fatty-acid--[acyl-carrier-protein] ligase